MMTDATRALVSRLAELLRREHGAMADFLVELSEFDRSRTWRELGYAGLFPFLHRHLGLSKASAFFRARAAQLIQRFPEIVEPLRDGRLCISTMAELAPMPNPPRRAVVTTVGVEQQPTAGLEPVAFETSSRAVCPGELALVAKVPSAAPESLPPPRRTVGDQAVPVTGDLDRLHVTVSRAFSRKLEAARLALSHAMPHASMEQVLEAGLDLILSRDAKRKGLVAHPRTRKPANEPPLDSRHVPAEVRRAVWARDQGRCQWPLEGGGICGSQLRAEFDHITPWAQGGPTTKENGRILCEPHNDYACRLAYGDEFVERVRRWRKRRARKKA